jgi:hypothetical protein
MILFSLATNNASATILGKRSLRVVVFETAIIGSFG